MSMFRFVRVCQTVLQSDCTNQFAFPPEISKFSHCFTSLPALMVSVFWFLSILISLRVVSYCCFNLYLVNDKWCWASVLIALINCHLYIFFHEMFVQGFFLFVVGLFVFLLLRFKSFCGFNNFFVFSIGIYNLVNF